MGLGSNKQNVEENSTSVKNSVVVVSVVFPENEVFYRVGAMAHWVRALSVKARRPEFKLPAPMSKLDMAVMSVSLALGNRDSQVLRILQPASQPRFRFSERLVSKNKVKSHGCYLCAQKHTSAHVCVCLLHTHKPLVVYIDKKI